MQARAAHKNLPDGMPAFFLAARVGLESLAAEPDRWRTAEQPALLALAGPDHTFKWELAPKPLPPDRYAFLLRLVADGKLSAAKGSVRDFGTNPYAIREWAEMLTAAFRRWREAPEDNAETWSGKRQLEQSILFMAGVLSHWVADASNPMHVSIHTNGWSPLAPNPNGYEGKNLHSRFETTFVNAAIEPEDVERFTPGEPRVLGPWLAEAESYLAAGNRHVEQIYAWDRAAPFGAGAEVPAAKEFTARRLADGARMVRDFWWSAWVKSGQPMERP